MEDYVFRTLTKMIQSKNKLDKFLLGIFVALNFLSFILHLIINIVIGKMFCVLKYYVTVIFVHMGPSKFAGIVGEF